MWFYSLQFLSSEGNNNYSFKSVEIKKFKKVAFILIEVFYIISLGTAQGSSLENQIRLTKIWL